MADPNGLEALDLALYIRHLDERGEFSAAKASPCCDCRQSHCWRLHCVVIENRDPIISPLCHGRRGCNTMFCCCCAGPESVGDGGHLHGAAAAVHGAAS